MRALPKRPKGPNVDLWDKIDYIEDMASWLGEAALALLHGQRNIKTTMSDSTAALQTEMAGLKTDVADLAEQTALQIQQLIDAQNSGDTATVALVTNELAETRNQLQALTSSLRADNPPRDGEPLVNTATAFATADTHEDDEDDNQTNKPNPADNRQ